MKSSNVKICISVAILAVFGGLLAYFVMPMGGEGKAGEKSAQKALRVVKVKGGKSAKKVERKVATRGRVAERGGVKKGVDSWGGKDPFATDIDFSFDDEKAAQLSDDLKSLIKELNASVAGFEPDRKRAYAALQKLLAKINAVGGGSSVPSFVKERALKAIQWVGSPALPEAIGFMADADPQVAKMATETAMDLLMDFDAKEADLVEAIKVLVKLESLTPEQCETIMFTTSSFKNSNKVAVALEVYDAGTDKAMAALSKNVDFIFEEAEAESIRTRADIVRYGKDHPDGEGTDFSIKFQ